MYSEFEGSLHAAEDHYLQPQEIEVFTQQLAFLEVALAIYERLRGQEIEIFQSLANRLQEVIAQEQSLALEQVLLRWMAVLRYAAMAMLLQSSDYLEQHLLAWFATTVDLDSTQRLDQQVSDGLINELKRLLSTEQMSLLQPLLEQAQTRLILAVPEPEPGLVTSGS